MSRKFSEARLAAFLKAVEETGNQTIAAERAKVSRSWVTMTHRADPEFDAAVREALDRFRTGCVRRRSGSRRGDGASSTARNWS